MARSRDSSTFIPPNSISGNELPALRPAISMVLSGALIRLTPGGRPGRGCAPRPPTRSEPDERTRENHRDRSEEHTSELQSRPHLVCRLLLGKKKKGGTTRWRACVRIYGRCGGRRCVSGP